MRSAPTPDALREPAPSRRATQGIDHHRPRKSLEPRALQLLEAEIAVARQSDDARLGEHLSRFGAACQTRGQVYRRPDGSILQPSRADRSDGHESACYSDAEPKFDSETSPVRENRIAAVAHLERHGE